MTVTELGVPAHYEAGKRAPRSVGRRIRRREDDRLLSGAGDYTDDANLARVVEMAVVRCPFPHARILAIDVSEALKLDGVLDILTGAEVVQRSGSIGLVRPDFEAPEIPYYGLADKKAVFEGQGVVSVVARTRHVAEDALELIRVEYDPLPAVSSIEAALDPESPLIYPDLMESNLLTVSEQGRGDVPATMRDADLVVDGEYRLARVTALPMETRAILAEWRTGANELSVRISTQVPHLVRRQLSDLLRIPDGSVRVISQDVGGGFGLKLGVYPEDIVACLHAMRLGAPVRWVEDRMEHFRASTHARESHHHYRIAARRDGTILAMEDEYTNDLGAANSVFGSAQQSTVVFSGPYFVGPGRVERRVAVTNKTPVGAYRGFGQPEVNFACERTIDKLARRLDLDPVELRLKNLVRADQLPWVNPVGSRYDSGNYEATLRMATAAVDYDDHLSRPRLEADGRYRGVGVAAYVERTGTGARMIRTKGNMAGSMFGAHESVTIRADYSGFLDLYTGVSSFGQGSETVFAQMCSECTGIDLDVIRIHVGDTASSPLNTGGFASRTVMAAAGAITEAAREFTAKCKTIAAWALGVDDPEELLIEGRMIRDERDSQRAIEVIDVFRRGILGDGIPPGMAPGLEATGYYVPSEESYAYGAAAAVVRVQPDTGEFEVEQFVMVHDCGVAINPLLVEGQVRGGIVQGLGSAMAESIVYDDASGQLVNGTMLDYFAPSAADVPPIELHHTEVPSLQGAFGVRGAGETGAIPVAAAIANAVCDALVEFGVEIDAIPVTPECVWRALQGSRT